MGNAKLEHRLLGIQKSRLLLDRINEALTVLRHFVPYWILLSQKWAEKCPWCELLPFAPGAAEALTVLRHKPGNGEMMYNIIFQTFLTPEKLTHTAGSVVYNAGVFHDPPALQQRNQLFRLGRKFILRQFTTAFRNPGCCWTESMKR